MRVFVSYRRDDSPAWAGRLSDALRQELGERNVFQDVVTIGAGEDFTEAIHQALDECDAVLVVIGPEWRSPPGVVDAPGTEDVDYVQIEVAAGLAKGLKVVPVLVGGADMPAAADLPDDLRPLTQRQAVLLHDESWHQDVDALIRSLHGKPRSAARSRRRPILVASAATVGVVVLAVGVWQLQRTGDGAAPEPALAACQTRSGAPWVRIGGIGATASAAIDGLDFAVVDGHVRELEEPPGTWEVILDTTLETSRPEAQTHGAWLYESLLVDGFAFPTKTCFLARQETVDPLSPKSSAAVGFEVERDPTGSLELIVEDSGVRDSIVVTAD